MSFPGPADRFLQSVRDIQGEGVVAKRLSSRYESGERSGAWVKMRLNRAQEFVIGGFTGGTDPFDSVLIGFYRERPRAAKLPPSRRQYVMQPRDLIYCASVRAGFMPATRREVYDRLASIVSEQCPFANVPQVSSGRWGRGSLGTK